MDFTKAELTMSNFPFAFPASKMERLVVRSTTRIAPYVHPRLDSILELCRTLPNGIQLLGLSGLE